jgi:glutathione-regulated potassium-efflux system ancillary protein KefG
LDVHNGATDPALLGQFRRLAFQKNRFSPLKSERKELARREAFGMQKRRAIIGDFPITRGEAPRIRGIRAKRARLLARARAIESCATPLALFGPPSTSCPVPARVLVLFAHPAFQKSRINLRLVAAVRALEGITFRDLYEEYPTFQIDVAREQELLVAHDIIVLQHPFYWYSCPALLKEWLDLVLEYGFAYGRGGDKLHGKTLLSAITTGGPEAAYSRSGLNHFTLPELLAPFEQTARLCGMTWLPPFAVHGTVRVEDPAQFDRDAVDYARILAALRDKKLAPSAARELPRLNANLAGLGL